MPPRRRFTRRTVLASTAAAAASTAVPTGAATEDDDQIPCTLWSEPVPGILASLFEGRADTYRATVDRIVDDEHVVILLEADDRVVDQIVVDHDRLSRVEELDHLLVTVDDDGDPESVCLLA